MLSMCCRGEHRRSHLLVSVQHKSPLRLVTGVFPGYARWPPWCAGLFDSAAEAWPVTETMTTYLRCVGLELEQPRAF